MNRSTIITIVILVALLVLAGAYTWYLLQRSAAEALDNSAAGQAFQSNDGMYTDILGNQLSLSDYIGAQVVVLSWASWCPSCDAQIRMLESVAIDYPEVTFLAINRAEPLTTATRYLEQKNLTTSQSVLFVQDSRDHFYKAIGGYAAPETVIFDATGNKQAHLRGDISADTLRTVLK